MDPSSKDEALSADVTSDPNSVKSKKPNTSPPVSKRSEGRAAVYGLLGAIIGGLASFGGAYWTGHQTESLNETESARSAYTAFIVAATQYEINLIHLPEAAGNANSYEQLRSTLNAEFPPFASDAIQVAFLTDSRTLLNDTQKLGSLLSIYIPLDPKSLNYEVINNINNNFGKTLAQFESDAETELNPAFNQ